MRSKRGFTLIELLIAIGIVALLSAVVLYFVNPKEFFAEARDSGRISSLNTLKVTLELARSNQLSLGVANTLYVSIPDPAATSTAGDQCQGLGLSSAPSGWTYHCASPANYLKVDGTGWLLVNFAAIPGGGSPVNPLPKDPVNTTSSGRYYTYGITGTDWELAAVLESNKDASFAANDGCSNPALYELGTCGITPAIASGGTPSASQYIYVSDISLNRIQKFDMSMSGNPILQFGSTGSGVGQLDHPRQIALDSSGNVYVVDGNNCRVQKFDPATGNSTLQFGSCGGADGQFNHPMGIAVDAGGNIYVSDLTPGNRVQKFDSTGHYSKQIGGCGSGNCAPSASAGQFYNPYFLAMDTQGNLYVADNNNNRVEKFDSGGGFLTQIDTGSSPYNYPVSVVPDQSGNMYVATQQSVRKFDASGNVIASYFGTSGSGNGQFNGAGGIALDGNGNVYVADGYNRRVQEFDANGNYLNQFGTYGTGNGQFYLPAGIAVY